MGGRGKLVLVGRNLKKKKTRVCYRMLGKEENVASPPSCFKFNKELMDNCCLMFSNDTK